VANGFDVLLSQHREVERQFRRYSDGPDDSIAREICEALTLHAAIEEKVLYPELRRMVDDGDDLADDAAAEHGLAKTIISRIYDSPPEDLRPLVADLERAIAAHVRFEEETLFPAMNDSGVDVDGLAGRLDLAASDVSARLS
jgi:hemerythrin superfamily protein